MTDQQFDRRSFLKSLSAFAASVNLPHENLLAPLLNAKLPPLPLANASLASLCHTVSGSFHLFLGRLQELQFSSVPMFKDVLKTHGSGSTAIEQLRTNLKSESILCFNEWRDTITPVLSNPRNVKFLRSYASLYIEEVSMRREAHRLLISEYQLKTNDTDDPGMLWVKASQERRRSGLEDPDLEIIKAYRVKKEKVLNDYEMPKELMKEWDSFTGYFASGTSVEAQNAAVEKLFDGSWLEQQSKSELEFWNSPAEEIAKSLDWLDAQVEKRRQKHEIKKSERLQKQKLLAAEDRELEFISWYGPFIDRAAFRY